MLLAGVLLACVAPHAGEGSAVLDGPNSCISPPSAGLAGTSTVTILGSGFGVGYQADSSARLGATLCYPLFWISEFSVNCEVAPGGGAGDATAALSVEVK